MGQILSYNEPSIFRLAREAAPAPQFASVSQGRLCPFALNLVLYFPSTPRHVKAATGAGALSRKRIRRLLLF
jgi:hypothetical protein